MNAHLTEAYLKTLTPTGKRVYHWDTGKDSIVGLGAVELQSGKIWLVYKYRVGKHRRQIGLGYWPALPLADARKKARQHEGELVVNKTDPLEVKAADRAMLTYEAWTLEYVGIVTQRKKNAYHDRAYLYVTTGGHGHEAVESEALKLWRTRPLDSISQADVAGWLQTIGKRGKTAANRAYAALRASLQEAVRRGVLQSNPCATVAKPYREADPRQRILTDAERKRLLTAIAELKDPYQRAYFHMLIFTGARVSEVLSARWENLDLDSPKPTWTIPSPKAGKPQSVPLPQLVASELRQLKRKPSSPWVFTARKRGTHRTTYADAWTALCTAAKLKEVHQHDLRRDFGTRAVRDGGIFLASRLLRHSDTRVTSRVYTVADADDLRDASNRLADVLSFPAAKVEGESR